MQSPQTQVFFLLLTNQVWRQVLSPFRGAETSSRARSLFRLATFVLRQNGNKPHDDNRLKQPGNKINRCQLVHLGAKKEKKEKTSSCRQHCHPGRILILQLFCDKLAKLAIVKIVSGVCWPQQQAWTPLTSLLVYMTLMKNTSQRQASI